MGSPYMRTLLAGGEAESPGLQPNVKEMMELMTKVLVEKGKQFIAEHFYHFRVKQMYQEGEDGEVRFKIETGLSLFGVFDLGLPDFDGIRPAASSSCA